MSTTTTSGAANARASVQRFGTFLSGMIMPNIGAFIAWGLITAFFISSGFTPVARLGGFGTHMVDGVATPWPGLVAPMIKYLLPLLIAYTGGKMAYNDNARGGVVGAIAAMGVIVGADIPMFIGAMIMGPLGGWTMKWWDSRWDGKIKPGFEMLVNNFSAGIWGMCLAVFSFFLVTPVVENLTKALSHGLQFLVNHHLLPLTSIIIEPAKVLFLNNAINHGVLTPIATPQAQATGKSIYFLLEANPGPGLGLLLAYMMFGKGASRASAPGAALIHFFGGIHEIYFPYVLAKPRLILATILGGMTGVATNAAFHTGLRAPAAPGSIIAILAQCPTGSMLGVILSVILAATVSCVVASFLLKTDKSEETDLAAATARMEDMKGKKSIASSTLVGGSDAPASTPDHEIKNIVFACDAGMGSSAMGATVLRNKIKDAGYGDVTVTNAAIANLKDNYDVVVTHQDLAHRAAPKVPSATLLTVDNFMSSPRYDEVVEMIRSQRAGDGVQTADVQTTDAQAAPVAAAPVVTTTAAPASSTPVEDAEPRREILGRQTIVLHGTAASRDEAIREAGTLLVQAGAVDNGYVDAMFDREKSVSTFMGNGLAIPHGTNEAKEFINASAMSFVRFDQPIDWNGNPVRFVIGIAGKNKEHLTILGKIARIFSSQDSVQALENAQSEQEILDILGKVNS